MKMVAGLIPAKFIEAFVVADADLFNLAFKLCDKGAGGLVNQLIEPRGLWRVENRALKPGAAIVPPRDNVKACPLTSSIPISSISDAVA